MSILIIEFDFFKIISCSLVLKFDCKDYVFDFRFNNVCNYFHFVFDFGNWFLVIMFSIAIFNIGLHFIILVEHLYYKNKHSMVYQYW